MPNSRVPPPFDDDPEIAAGELALDLIDGEERAAALRRIATDAAFAGKVEAWRHRLAGILDNLPPTIPSSDIWPRIDRHISPGRASVGRWKVVALASLAAAACLALLVFTRPVERALPPPRDDLIVAQLSNADGLPLVVAHYEPATAVLRVRTDHLTHEHLAPELWMIGRDARPRSLGLIASRGTTVITVDKVLQADVTGGGTLAVTFEPRDGAPHAAPSGSILASAKLVSL